jgi:protein-S-isoprenylcysteine O-methyltransferase Ste14
MYVAVLVIVMGWTLWFASSTLLIYLLFLAIAFHLRILTHEEPRLALSFGEDWRAYRARVARWVPRPVFARRKAATGRR